MRHALAVSLALVLTACSGAQKPTCTEQSLNALRELYGRAARDVIESGACDSVERIEKCASYRAVEADFKLAMEGMCH
jgi:hypothetical protein